MRNLLYFILLFSLQWCYGQTVNINGIINEYTPVFAFTNCNSIEVGSSSGFSVGDKVLIIQMKGAEIDTSNSSSFGTITTYNETGNYEFNFIQSISGNTIYLQFTLLRMYDLNHQVQLVKVPVYQNALVTNTLTCLQWNGTVGGILVFDVLDTLSLNANIDVSGLGFVGGIPSNNLYVCSFTDYFCTQISGNGGKKGESILDYSNTNECGRGANATGGGGGNNTNTGGGGGGNGGAGGTGGKQYYPCGTQILGGIGGNAPVYTNTQNKVYLGSGGGGGHQNDSQGGDGGNGGGIIIITANTVVNYSFKIKSNGENGSDSWGDGAGGGGSGGTILLNIQNYPSTITIESKGGKGGDNGNTQVCHGSAGGGGGGFIWSTQPLPTTITTVLTGGSAGIANASNCLNSTYGASDGNPGDTLSGLILPLSTIPNSTMVLSLSSTGSCTGPSLGTASVTVTGGTSPYSYLWNTSPVQTSSTAVNLSTGNYTVTVTDSSGCTISDTISVFNYNIFASASPDTNACSGDTITLWSAGGNSYSWTGINGTVITPNQAQTQVIPNSGTSYFTVIVSNLTGCTDTITVQVDVIIPLSISIPSVPPICDGDTITLSAVLQNGNPQFQYTWSPSVYLSNSTISNPQAFPSYSTTYYLSVLDACGTILNDSVYVEVIAEPILDLLANPVSVCIGSVITVYLATNPDSGVITNWNFGSAQVLSGTGDGPYLISFQSSDTFFVSVSGSYNGCSGTIDSIVLFVTPPLDVFIGNDTIICQGGTVLLNASITGGNGSPVQYSWAPSGFVQNPGNQNTIGNPPGNTEYIVTATDGCNQPDSDSLLVTLFNGITVTGNGPFTICEGDTLILGATVSGGNGGPYSFIWSPASGVSDPFIQNPYFIDTLSAGFEITVTDGCSFSASDSVFVNVHPRPNALLTQGDTVCEGSKAILTATSDFGLTIHWLDANGTTLYEGNSYVIPNLTQPTIYYAIAVDFFGCKSYAVPSNASIFPLPEVDFLASTTSTEIPYAIVSFDGQVQTQALIASYYWEFGDGLTDDFEDPVHQYSNEGLYSVLFRVVDVHGCIGERFKPDYITVGKDIRMVVPNVFSPNGDGVNDDFWLSHRLVKDFHIYIFDRWGNLIYENRDLNFRWNGYHLGNPLPEGVYTYLIKATAVEGTPLEKSGTVMIIH